MSKHYCIAEIGLLSKPGAIFACCALFWCCFTFTMDGWLIWGIVKQWQASGYASTTGTVTHSEVVRGSGKGGGFMANVQYSYIVAGERFTADRRRYDTKNANREEVDKIVARYPPQQLVTVYYNPRRPGDAVLELGLSAVENAGACLVATPFNAAAVGFLGWFYVCLLSLRLGRPVAGIRVRKTGLQTSIRIYEQSPALGALVGLGFGAIFGLFGGALLTFIIPLREVIITGWCVALTLMVVAWWWTRKKYVEVRRDLLSDIVEVRRGDGSFRLAPANSFEAFWPKRKKRQQEPYEEPRFPIELRFADLDGRRRSVKLPNWATAREATRLAEWLNGLLELPRNRI